MQSQVGAVLLILIAIQEMSPGYGDNITGNITYQDFVKSSDTNSAGYMRMYR
jgi:hypothetical protein